MSENYLRIHFSSLFFLLKLYFGTLSWLYVFMKYVSFLLVVFVVVFARGQQVDSVDFKTAKADISFGDLNKKEVFGTIQYTFEILKDVDSVFVDARAFKNIKYVLDDTFKGEKYNGSQLIVKHNFKKGDVHVLDITWETQPKKAMYFIDWSHSEGNKQIWTQGQGKYTSNWLPSFDDMNEKVEFDISISFNNGYHVISNGKLIKKDINGSQAKWHYNMEAPMASYLVAIAIGKYHKKVEYSNSNIPLELYYYPKDSLKFEPTYRYTKKIFDFLENEIEVPYPWQNYKQIPVKDFLYAGMENTSTTIFSDSFVIDSVAFVDKNYVNVNAHELAHQWFGDLVTETSGTHHWLQEGFATYYALLAEKAIFGEDYYHWRLYEYANELLAQDKAGQSTSLLNPKSSSVTFYKKGAWVLHILREKIGDKAFTKAVKSYLLKHQFKNVETNDFISEVEVTSGLDLSKFKNDYLLEKHNTFLNEKVLLLKNKILYKSAGLSALSNPLSEDLNDFRKEQNKIKLQKLSSSISTETKVEFFNDLFKDSLVNKIELYKTALSSKNIKVRQAVAQNLNTIPLELKTEYELLLADKSYLTIEIALFNLWQNFPQQRKKYLYKTQYIQGFKDKNVRILWLTLALITEDFEIEKKKQYFEELTAYTSDIYGFEIRQNAFRYLNEIRACNNLCIKNLEAGIKHHNWQFSKFAKQLLNDMSK